LGYPAAVFAGVANAVADLLADADQITATGQGDVPSVPDPDVETLEITLQVTGLDFDSANDERGPPPLRNVYTTTRPFPADPPQPARGRSSWTWTTPTWPTSPGWRRRRRGPSPSRGRGTSCCASGRSAGRTPGWPTSAPSRRGSGTPRRSGSGPPPRTSGTCSP